MPSSVIHSLVPAKAFSVGYVKGQARALSLLALLSVMHEMNVTAEVLLKEAPKFHDTVSLIWVQRIQEGSRSEEALLNMKLSLRGTLRKACNVVQICEMIRRLTLPRTCSSTVTCASVDAQML